MHQHDLSSKVFLPDVQDIGTKPRRKAKAKNDLESKKIRQIERSKVLRVLAASTVPLSAAQIKAETGKLSNPKLLIAYLKHQRCIEIAYRSKSITGPFEEDYYRIVRPAPTEGGAECQPA